MILIYSVLKDYYKILEVDYDANEEMIKLNYRKLALVSKRTQIRWLVFRLKFD